MTQSACSQHPSRSRVAACGALLLMAACVAVVMPAASAAPAAGAGPDTTALYVVVYRDGVDARTKATSARIKPTFFYSHALDGFAANLTEAQRNWLAADPQILMISQAVRVPTPTPAPPFKPMGPIKDIPAGIPHGIKRVGALASPTAAIDQLDTRVDVDIAVIDTGLDAKQPDLNVLGGVSCTTGRWQDDTAFGHGTMVAGVAAELDNKFGAVGVAPGARLWGVRVFDDTGNSNDSNLLCGLDWVQDHQDTIDVANLSLGDFGSDDGNCGLTNHDPVHWAICHVVNQGRVTVVASAGNDSVDASGAIPAAYPEVIAVSAMADSDGLPGGVGGTDCMGDADDVFSFFSNFGAAIDIAAPGQCVVSTYPKAYLASGAGTSFAAPHVAGGAALYLARHPDASPQEVRSALIANREDVALPGDPDGINEGVLNVSGF